MSCPHAHPRFPTVPTNPAQNLLPYIDLPRVEGANVANPPASRVLKSPHEPIASLYGPEMLLIVPFSTEVKVYSILLQTDVPVTLAIWKNPPSHLDLGTALPGSATFHAHHPAHSIEPIEHHLPRHRFAGVTCVALLLRWEEQMDFDNSLMDVSYLEFRGESTSISRAIGSLAHVVYEKKPQLEDHKTMASFMNNALLQ